VSDDSAFPPTAMTKERWQKLLQYCLRHEEFSGAVLQSESTRALHRELVDEWLRPTPEDIILDLGCGPGWSTSYIAKRCALAVGVTILEAEFQHAQAQHSFLGRCMFFLEDMHALSFPEAYFTKVYSRESFEHSPAPFLVCLEVRRLLRPGGIFVVNVPGPSWIDYPAHYSVLNKDQMLALFKRAEFEVIQHGHSSAGHFIYKVRKPEKA